MDLPRVYTCSQSWTPLPLPSPYHLSGSSQCTSPKHPASCIKPRLAIHFLYDIIHVSMPFSQIIPPSPSPTESKRLFYTSVSLLLSCMQAYHYREDQSQVFLVAQMVRSLPGAWETQVQSLGWEDPLEKEMATYPRILACKIPRREEPGGPQSMNSQRVRHDWATALYPLVTISLFSMYLTLFLFCKWVHLHYFLYSSHNIIVSMTSLQMAAFHCFVWLSSSPSDTCIISP